MMKQFLHEVETQQKEMDALRTELEKKTGEIEVLKKELKERDLKIKELERLRVRAQQYDAAKKRFTTDDW